MSDLRIRALEQRVAILTKELAQYKSANDKLKADIATATELGFDGLMRYNYKALSARQIDIALDSFKAGFEQCNEFPLAEDLTKKQVAERMRWHRRKYIRDLCITAEKGDFWITTKVEG